jgi:hypothetical protein
MSLNNGRKQMRSHDNRIKEDNSSGGVVSYEWEWNHDKDTVYKFVKEKGYDAETVDTVWIRISREMKYAFIKWYKENIKSGKFEIESYPEGD